MSEIQDQPTAQPTAESIEWSALPDGHSYNLQSHRLVCVNAERYELRPTIMMRLVEFAVFLLGVSFMLLGLFLMFWAKYDPGEYLFNFLGSALFVALGAVIACFARKFRRGTIVFDQRADAYVSEREGNKVQLSRICALQLFRWICDANGEGPYDVFELNLIRQDGSRVHVLTHGDLQSIRADAHELARLLGVPLWEKTDEG
ncbi:MAG: hypothetical protein KDB14_04165 [Planctomycetales bacterium]|nr:hypothetical protein [Planctomycetales bacterium]